MRKRQRKKNFKKWEREVCRKICKATADKCLKTAEYFEPGRFITIGNFEKLSLIGPDINNFDGIPLILPHLDPRKEIELLPVPNQEMSFAEFTNKIMERISKVMSVGNPRREYEKN